MYPSELPAIPTGKVPFPTHYYEIAERDSSSNLMNLGQAILQGKPAIKFVVLIPFKNESVAASNSDGDVAGSLFHVGVIAKIVQVSHSRKEVKLSLRAVVRCEIKALLSDGPYLKAKVASDKEDSYPPVKDEAASAFRRLVLEYVEKLGIKSVRLLDVIQSAPVGALSDALATAWDISYDKQLALLEAFDPTARIQVTAALLPKTKRSASSSSSSSLSSSRAISAPFQSSNQSEGGNNELSKLQKRLREAGIPKGEAWDTISKDLQRLQQMAKQSSEFDMLRNYLEFVADLPWSKQTTDHLTLSAAKKQLEDDHEGLQPIKRRIIEYLAVLKLRKDMKAPILCFIGPPGTGKSSLGQSVADALGRKFHRIALGGVRDEAVIRGHRRTYIGALPGRILEGLKKVGVNNPVVLLDEIDKLAADYRGDPAAALLEVLDPVQNHAFTDHYLGVPFDLSNVLFIATGNSANIPAALLDRMELIEVPGYSFEEKVNIARKHLLPKQLEAHGLPAGSVVLTDDALMTLARSYTRESGVRTLNREIGAIVRYIAASVVKDGEKETSLAHEGLKKIVSTIDAPQLAEILGPAKYEEDARGRLSRLGVAMGLGYLGTGSGSVLYIESTQMPGGKGKLTLTGQLGDVMKESATTAISWIRSNAAFCQVKGPILEGHDLHVHFPAGATPKDGPSAGVAITVSLVSLLSQRRVRDDVAMTGEISLTGVVLPVGGIKEKVLAAHRNGVKRIYLPKSNMKDLHDVPDHVKNHIDFVPVSIVEEVLESVFADSETMKSKL